METDATATEDERRILNAAAIPAVIWVVGGFVTAKVVDEWWVDERWIAALFLLPIVTACAVFTAWAARTRGVSFWRMFITIMRAKRRRKPHP